MTPAAAFDAIADRYDELWTETPTGRAQRELVWSHVDPLFREGDAVIDIGCGTGADAKHLAQRGVRIHAIDPSPLMIGRVAAGVWPANHTITAAIALAEDVEGRYDGVLSNFGALNCVDDLPAVAARLGAAVQPGGHVAICVIGRFCLWETLFYLARFNLTKAIRRFRHRAVTASIGVRVYYRSVQELRDAFSAAFECQRWTGVGLLVPPSYVKLPGPLVRALALFDRLLAHLPILRGMADHRLLILRRR